MKIDVSFTPAGLSKHVLSNKRVVMVDVLRASTSIVTALVNGAKGIIPCGTIEEAREKAGEYPESGLLCGERGGVRIEGFDLGNSPGDYGKQKVRNKILIFTSTNGSGILVKSAGSPRILIGGFVNLNAVVSCLAQGSEDILIACAGCEGLFSLEDTVCAGMIIRCLLNRIHKGDYGDEAAASMILYDHYASSLEKMIRSAAHGKILIGLGFESDLEYCISVDRFNRVPVFRDGIIKG